ncbi:MAG: serine hydrolase domain-containing protein [Myxococcota bacterium]
MVRWVWLALVGGCAELPQRGTLGAELDQRVDAELKGGSLVAAVFRDGEIARFAGYGEVSDGGPIPDQDSPYRVGSLSKTFTALAVMQLVEEGALDLDAPLTDALPSFATGSAPSRPITMRDLLTHQSGLVSDQFVQMLGDDVGTMEQTTALLASEELAADPGVMWSYSNVGFNVAGHAAQEVSGVPFADLVAQRIFEPCGMDGATWDFDAAVQGYDGGRPADEGSGISTPPAGAAVMSIRDLAAYAGGLTDGGLCPGGALVSPDTLASMWAAADVPAISGDPQQGMGFFVDPAGRMTDGVALAAHPGDTLLFHTNFLLAPELGIGVAVMASERDASGLVWELGFELLREEIARVTGREVPEVPLADPSDDGDRDLLDTLEGVYTTELGVLDLRRRGEGLNSGSVRLVPTDDGTYRIRPRVLGVRLPFLVDELDVRFDTIERRDVVQARINGAFQTIGERVDPPPDLFGWDAHLGKWDPATDRDGGSLSLTEVALDLDRDGYLWATLELDQLGESSEFEALLRPLDPRRARVEGIGRYRGEVVTLDGGELGVLGARFSPR